MSVINQRLIQYLRLVQGYLAEHREGVGKAMRSLAPEDLSPAIAEIIRLDRIQDQAVRESAPWTEQVEEARARALGHAEVAIQSARSFARHRRPEMRARIPRRGSGRSFAADLAYLESVLAFLKAFPDVPAAEPDALEAGVRRLRELDSRQERAKMVSPPVTRELRKAASRARRQAVLWVTLYRVVGLLGGLTKVAAEAPPAPRARPRDRADEPPASQAS